MWVIKIGGSWIKNPRLDELIGLISNFRNENITLVVGGGCFADSVRDVFSYTKMTQKTANFLALKATEIFAYFLKEKNKNLFLTSDMNEFFKGKVRVWLPSLELSANSSFEKNWGSTSDSVAAWLYSHSRPPRNNLKKYDHMKGLIFIKSLNFEMKKKYKLNQLQKKNILDKNVKKYLIQTNWIWNWQSLTQRRGDTSRPYEYSAGFLKIAGPEVIELLKKSPDWSSFILRLSDIIY